ncbi:FAD binding domain-containing protein [Candidatus Poriferisodalis sp.]|uniref:FAD binding domain-containing protein n=1 Tax=Candidatus Poriferisodalis sp. TaxID=3101277 RepID=UPI003B52A13D
MKYAAPTTIDEARALLAGDTDAIVFAGATDVVPQMRGGRPEPSMVIDLKKIDRLMSVSLEGDTWHVGAAAPSSSLTGNAAFSADFPGLSEAAGLIGSDQIQNRSSLGGNLCNASPAADSVPALVVNDAVAVIAGAQGERRVPVADVVTGPGQTSLAHDEIVVCFELTRSAANTADAYLRLIPRTEMDIAVVGAGVRLTLDDDGTVSGAAVALGAVAPTVVRVPAAETALVGSRLDDASLAAAAAAASDACNPIDDKRGTINYRRQVTGVLTRRAARIAADRIRTRNGQPANQQQGDSQ